MTQLESAKNDFIEQQQDLINDVALVSLFLLPTLDAHKTAMKRLTTKSELNHRLSSFAMITGCD